MKRLPLWFTIAGILTCAALTRADEAPTAWGIPLGVTADQLRSAIGPASEQRTPQPHPSPPAAIAPLLNALDARPSHDEYWTYHRNGARIVVTLANGKTTVVSIQGNFDPTISDDPNAYPADPFGLRVGDGVGALLVKTGTVREIDPHSSTSIIQATIFTTRGKLNYNFQISGGRIFIESIYLRQ